MPKKATNQKVSWKSSNTKIASVNSSGLVKEVSIGTATITATTYDEGIKATCKVTVVPAATKISKVETTAKGLKITWKNVSGVTGYEIHRSTDGKSYKKVATIKKAGTVSYSDNKAKSNGTQYYYKVYTYKTENGKNYKSDPSSEKMTCFLSQTRIKRIAHDKIYPIIIDINPNTECNGYEIQMSTDKNFKKGIVKDSAEHNGASKIVQGNFPSNMLGRSYLLIVK